MDEKTKLYVFEKKEVALIFIFMILIASTSFIFGIKIGKNYSFKNAGLKEEDLKKIELLSSDEEQVQSLVEVDQKRKLESTDKQEIKDLAFQKLKEKIDSEFSGGAEVLEKKNDSAKPALMPKEEGDVLTDSPQSETKKTSNEIVIGDQYTGKFTIQLGSHRAADDAEKFADGFRIRGYNPVITEVKIKERGTWYRVSLGVFDSIGTAKEYIIKEKSLFQDLDYVIGKFD